MTKTIGLAAITGLIAVFVARADGAPTGRAAGTLAADSATLVAGSSVKPRWLRDEGILALLGIMNARHVAAADIELSSWHSDTVRAFAASMAREHAAMQHSVDSVASTLKLAPVVPAVGEEINRVFQAQIDSMMGRGGSALDRAYVSRQIVSHKLMADYLNQMTDVAERPEIQSVLRDLAARVAAQQSRAQTLQAAFAVADSIVADSLAQRAARRTRGTGNR